MTTSLKLSIITISYNDINGLSHTISSIHDNNTHDWFEHIIIDGGSEDGSKEYLEENTHFFSYWQSQKDGGIYDAMNIGLSKAKGEFVWFMNSADTVFDKNVFNQITNHLNSENDVIYGECMYVNGENKDLGLRGKITTRKIPNNLTLNELRNGMIVSHQSLLVRKAIAPNYNTQLQHVADYDWLIRIMKKTTRSKFINYPFSRFLVGGHSTENRKSSNKERFGVMRNHFGLIVTCYTHFKKFLNFRTYLNKLS